VCSSRDENYTSGKPHEEQGVMLLISALLSSVKALVILLVQYNVVMKHYFMKISPHRVLNLRPSGL
jgi:hypothetical protein